jgi:hypothetical protein
MNRLVIIGNGFDLANGLKTSYRDFINDFWEREKEKVVANCNVYPNLDISFIYKYDCENYAIAIDAPTTIKDATNRYGYDGFKFVGNHLNGKLIVKNTILRFISETMYQNWVDIEETYYRELCNCLCGARLDGIKQLNKEFAVIKKALEDYLNNISEISSKRVFQYFDKAIPIDEKPISNVLFLNFNYTRTINHYVDRYDSVINIHGDLKNPDNPIIFGYGDEVDEHSKEIENTKNNEYLWYMKTIEYIKTSCYKQLCTFIEADKYEIFIVGHSCGISDRTLLNKLFEDKHCQRIKIFYHKREDGTDNFNDILYNIYRIFNDKNAMRDMVISKEESIPL